MRTFEARAGRVRLCAAVHKMGRDYCVVLTGGDAPHLGAVTLSEPRPSLADPAKTSASTSVLCRTGHKDDVAAKSLGEKLAAVTGRPVAVCCGIHLDDLAPEELPQVLALLEQLELQVLEALG